MRTSDRTGPIQSGPLVINSHFFARALFAACALLLPDSLVAAPRILGPNKCTSCHTHQKEKQWAAKDEHAKALGQLEDKNAAAWAKAIGLSDPYSLKGSCVSCHATVFSGDANAGVSCESCHGPGSDYLEPHQQKGAHAKSVSLGLFDTRGSPEVWAKMCVDCHIVNDKKLVAAGHPSGTNFEVAGWSKRIVHWDDTYDWARLAAAGKAAMAKRPGGAPPPPPKEPTAAAPKEERKPSPSPVAPAVRSPSPTAKTEATKPALSPAPALAPTKAAAAAPAPSDRPVALSPTSPVVRVTQPSKPATVAQATVGPRVPSPVTAGPTVVGIEIVIEATPVPTVTARPTEPLQAPAPPQLVGEVTGVPPTPPKPVRTLRRPPRTRPPAPRTPLPAPTPTRRPGPAQPPSRAPHWS